MSYASSLIAAVLQPTHRDLARASLRAQQMPSASVFRNERLYTDTRHRMALRDLLTGAALAQAEVLLAFWKSDHTLRYMRCEAVAGADETAAYVTVKDLDLSAQEGRPIYRRVCLDTIVKVEVTYTAAEGV